MIVKINGRNFDQFNEIGMTTTLDTVASTFYIKARFNPNNEFHREIFRPLSYNRVEFFDNNNNILFTGTSINTSLTSSSVRQLQEVSGYSLAGVIDDSTIPQSYYPLERNNVTLQDIAQTLLSEFNLTFEVMQAVQNDMLLEYAKTTADPEQGVKDFLAKLASQRNIIMGHNVNGGVVFFRLNLNATPVMRITPQNCLSMNNATNGQGMYSDIVVIRQQSTRNPNIRPVDTINNPLVTVNRVLTKVLSSGTETDTSKAAENVLAKQLQAIKITVNFERIAEANVGDIVEIVNPEIYIFNFQRMVVSDKSITRTPESTTSALTLVLPESFNGSTPKNIFEI